MPQHHFTNWSRTYSCDASHFINAHNEDDVTKAIELARSIRKPLRVVGSGHSPSDIVCTDGVLLSLDHMKSVVKVDKSSNTITVMAGIKLWMLNEVLHKLGWALPNLGSIAEQSIAGAISTCTHGTGVSLGNLSTAVVGLTLINANGTIQTITKNDNPSLFSAAACSLGALGVITRVTLKCPNSFRLKAYQLPIKFNEMVESFDQLAASADHVRFHWFPLTEDCVMWKAGKTAEAIQPAKSNWWNDKLRGYYLYEAALYASAFLPSITPVLNRGHFALAAGPTNQPPSVIIDDSYRVFAMECLFRQYVSEWAIDRKDAPAALKQLKALILEKKWMVHAPVEVRFVQKDDIMLSPAYRRDTCYIGIIMYKPYERTIPHAEYWTGFENIMKSFGGRPHWAKAFQLGPSELSKIYPRFTDFVDLVRKMDPEGIFANDYIKRHILGSKNPASVTSKL
ncbi:hypothetical protein SmJEL517_g01749 [Synchytrium microbalum]|uniref:D-arabinono-1,4-lactone oxidase n=1 Tax=Synchytrium microbalum TaxID=1806994 RepID=A0A507C998_9FUNG|nr:uncharacterized protein SmJEL517_g01749 [Synchytrium microbalum]TPX35928.1 hypothetical protein SmJEL517_g01749 [Synchytrium microbalum]